MRPETTTPAHKTGNLAELVCSNTFKSLSPTSAPGLFKRELGELGCMLLRCAPLAQVPAGEALAVDRELFSKAVEKELLATGLVERISKRVESIESLPEADATIIATGPLTQGPLAETIRSLSDGHGLYFYDAIAPVIDASTVNREIAFAASRYGKGGDDYLNCPMTKEEYDRFYDALMAAEKMEYHDFEEAKFFQGCQPIEAIAETGRDSLRFGPMKPVGLSDPRTGKRPWAVVQLRIDNVSKSAYNLVGFQTKLKYPEQKKVFSLIPALENAEFLRLGSMHRNTYICSPTMLSNDFSLKKNRNVFFAGQITGCEGYTESTAVGLLASIAILQRLAGREWKLPSRTSAVGALCNYLFHSNVADFQPVNVHFGIFDKSAFNLSQFDGMKKAPKDAVRAAMVEESLANLRAWRDAIGWEPIRS